MSENVSPLSSEYLIPINASKDDTFVDVFLKSCIESDTWIQMISKFGSMTNRNLGLQHLDIVIDYITQLGQVLDNTQKNWDNSPSFSPQKFLIFLQLSHVSSNQGKSLNSLDTYDTKPNP